MHIDIRAVDHAYFDDWLRLRGALYADTDEATHRAEMAAWCGPPDRVCLIAVAASRPAVVGFIEVSLRNIVGDLLSGPVGFLESIYVQPAYRGRGIARRLVAAAEDWCRAQGAAEMASDAELDNAAAHAFHRHMGFEECGRVVEYKKRL